MISFNHHAKTRQINGLYGKFHSNVVYYGADKTECTYVIAKIYRWLVV